MYEFLQAVQIFAGEHVVHPPMDVDVLAAAAGFYQSILCFVTIMVVNGIIRKINSDYALF